MSRPRPFAASSAIDGVRRERVGADAVDRVGGQHHELAAAYGVAGQVEPDRPLGRRSMSYRRSQAISRPPLSAPAIVRTGRTAVT